MHCKIGYKGNKYKNFIKYIIFFMSIFKSIINKKVLNRLINKIQLNCYKYYTKQLDNSFG